VFDIFKRRQQEKWFMQGRAIKELHDQMRSDVPAAAYLFARTLYNSHPLIQDSSITLDQKIAVIESQIRSDALLNNADAGIPIIALRFIRTLLQAQRQVDIGSFALSGAFGAIAPSGAHYRELEERDQRPAVNEDARRILMKRGHQCLAELINAVRADTAAAAKDSSSADEDVWTLLAMYDLQEEAASGRLAPYLRGLESAVG
jgi:hypothetical protein